MESSNNSGYEQAVAAATTTTTTSIKVKVVASLVGDALLADIITKEEGVSDASAAMKTIVAIADGKGQELYPIKMNGFAHAEAFKLSMIDEWLDFSSIAIDAPIAVLYHNAKQSSKDAIDSAKNSLVESLSCIENALAGKSFVVGNTLTLADISLVCGLAPLYESKTVVDISLMDFPAVKRWVGSCFAIITKSLGVGSLLPCIAQHNGTSNERQKLSGNDDDTDEKAKAKAAKKKEKDAAKAAKAAKVAAKKKAAEEAAAKAAASGPSKSALRKAAKAKAANSGNDEEKAYLEKVLATAKGTKKDLGGDMPKAYSPKFVEAAWYSWWEESGFFKPSMDSTKPPFVIVIPPPNVTGSLHLGHALTNSLQDAITRWKRMCGFNALWLPGTDHAGIATQTVVEKKLQRDSGISRHDLGREKFLDKVFEWKEQYGNRINMQLRRLGSSLDWSREAFTMDAKLSKAVQKAFVTMSRNGVIYRDNRLVNWCCRLKSAISDIEVDYIDIEGFTKLKVPGQEGPVEFGVLTSFAYPLVDGTGEIVVATTRPETMLGDTAVAVHPDDPRYTAMHGKMLVHPFNGRQIPIITDSVLVDMSFGTGAVKITPAHDPNDFATGQRHKLEMINIFTDDGRINHHGGEFEGQKRFESRITVVDALKGKGLFRGVSANPMRLGLCSRTKDVIEPMLKPQWWVDCKDMAAKSCEAVRDRTLKIVPSEFEATWFRWLENIRDWCVSRQLWWGHRIPAFYVKLKSDKDVHSPGGPTEKMDRWIICATLDEAQKMASDKYGEDDVASLEQDEDVLDTWFSSGLFPFSTMGWPDDTEDLSRFFPNSLLETGHDILFFWVARMVMMSLHLTGKVPFHTVYLHAMVRDAHGRKMSKSLGNVIDPIQVIEGISLEGLHQTLLAGNLDEKELVRAKEGQTQDFPEGIEECGTDALRFALCAYTSQARDINLDIKRVIGYRYWCNKLWNAIRFAMMNLGGNFFPTQPNDMDVATLPVGCQWVISRLNYAVNTTQSSMEAYDFTAATTAIYAFWQYELCDVFIEIAKPYLSNESNAVIQSQWRQTLWTCLDTGLKLLHPFMPFVTEELWQRLPKCSKDTHCTEKSIMLTTYPTWISTWQNDDAEASMTLADATVRSIRGIRAQYGLTKQKPALYLIASDKESLSMLESVADYIKTLTLSSSVSVSDKAAPSGCAGAHVSEKVEAHLDMAGVLDPTSELRKLDKKLSETVKQITTLTTRMSMENYETKVPDKIKEDNKTKFDQLQKEKKSIEKMIGDFQAMNV